MGTGCGYLEIWQDQALSMRSCNTWQVPEYLRLLSLCVARSVVALDSGEIRGLHRSGQGKGSKDEHDRNGESKRHRVIGHRDNYIGQEQ